MNIFRLVADLSHLASIIILLRKIQTSRSCRGLPFRSAHRTRTRKLLYATVFITRYLDLFHPSQFSLYNIVMKIFFITSSVYILFLMKVRFRPTNDPSIDTFRVEYLIGPALILALIFNYSYNLVEVFWSFSIFLESLFILQRTGEAETITTHYLAALGAYFVEDLVDPISIIAGLVQTGLYLDFFYVYFTRVLQGQKFELPA
ncbi:ER lumen protein retaining receptor [Lactarius hatsudake]|nr:ER lumen protein retaining receptor [Lactarius hatsudake]